MSGGVTVSVGSQVAMTELRRRSTPMPGLAEAWLTGDGEHINARTSLLEGMVGSTQMHDGEGGVSAGLQAAVSSRDDRSGEEQASAGVPRLSVDFHQCRPGHAQDTALVCRQECKPAVDLTVFGLEIDTPPWVC